MKKQYALILIATLILMTACGTGESDSASTIQQSVSDSVGQVSSDSAQDDESLDVFAGNIAKNFSNVYGFKTSGKYSDSDGIIITITAEGSSEWLDHAWDEMKDSIAESYNESISTMNRAGTGDTSLTYLVCDADGVSYLRYVNGEVVDLAGSSRQSIQD